MNCRTFSKSLKDYIAGELSEDINEAMEKHMNRCEKCSMLYEREYSTYKAIESMALPQYMDFTSSRYEILQSIDKKRYNKSFKNKVGFYMKRNSFKYALGAVAIIAIILLSSVAINQFKNLNIMDRSHVEEVPKTNSNIEKNASPASSNENNVPASNSSNKDATSNNSKTKDTPPANPTQERKSNNEVNKNTIYKNDKLGLSFTVPESWNGKYTVREQTYGLDVFFKPTGSVPEGSGLLFCIIKEVPGADDPLYSVGDQKTIVAKGITYVVDGPRDIGFPPENKEYNDYKKLQKDVPNVAKTIKASK